MSKIPLRSWDDEHGTRQPSKSQLCTELDNNGVQIRVRPLVLYDHYCRDFNPPRMSFQLRIYRFS